MKEIYWIGPRQSDICDIAYLFKGSITIYGDNKNGNVSYCDATNRINHNLENESYNKFVYKHLKKLIVDNPNVSFLFYNQEDAYCYDSDIERHSIGVNNKYLLESLSNKARCRYLFSNIVDVIPYVTLKGSECLYKNLCKYFPNKEFVVQKILSSGGAGTYHIKTQDTDIENDILQDNYNNYLLSPYLDNGVSLNIHTIISEDTILLSQPSVQITQEINSKILYSGADFVVYNNISEEIKKQLKSSTLKICSLLKERGYRGVLGIDFLLHNNTLYFMELNPRFQASTQLVNKALKSYKNKSLQELHLLAFENKIENEDMNIPVQYSNIVYSTNNISITRLKKVVCSNEIICAQMDGYSFEKHNYTDEDVYLCRCIFAKNISFIRNKKLILHPNLYVENIKNLIMADPVNQKRNIKFALLNHGVTLTKQATELADKNGTIKKAVFDAIDITIFDDLKVNVPFSCSFTSLSPFTIDVFNNEFILLFDEEKISNVNIDFIPAVLNGKKTLNGVSYESIITFATDRIRINPAPVCIYKKEDIACKFCNLPHQNENYDFDDIKEAIDYCLKNLDFRHFLIGGGTYSLNGGWDFIISIVKYIRNKCGKDIYLMSIPPKDKSILIKLKKAGITEVAFNLEIFDRELAEKIMPGKGKIPIAQYLDCFQYSVELWGNSGNVRSLLIYGFDTDDIFIDGIEKLCKIGVEPIISIFRPLEGTQCENQCPPATSDIISIYEKCQKIAENYSLSLGPDCVDCQNNTLSFS